MIRMTQGAIATALLFSFTACGPTTPTGYQSLSAPVLWGQLQSANDTREIMLLEAELASRGETIAPSGDEYIGRRTSGTVSKALYQREPTNSDRNCSDFPSAAEAQRFFLKEGGPTQDPHGLDRDGDGNACEWGSNLKSGVQQHRQYVASQAAAARKARSVSRRRASVSQTCYTGPRGGTYTLTASGNKNYDGC